MSQIISHRYGDTFSSESFILDKAALYEAGRLYGFDLVVSNGELVLDNSVTGLPRYYHDGTQVVSSTFNFGACVSNQGVILLDDFDNTPQTYTPSVPSSIVDDGNGMWGAFVAYIESTNNPLIVNTVSYGIIYASNTSADDNFYTATERAVVPNNAVLIAEIYFNNDVVSGADPVDIGVIYPYTAGTRNSPNVDKRNIFSKDQQIAGFSFKRAEFEIDANYEGVLDGESTYYHYTNNVVTVLRTLTEPTADTDTKWIILETDADISISDQSLNASYNISISATVSATNSPTFVILRAGSVAHFFWNGTYWKLANIGNNQSMAGITKYSAGSGTFVSVDRTLETNVMFAQVSLSSGNELAYINYHGSSSSASSGEIKYININSSDSYTIINQRGSNPTGFVQTLTPTGADMNIRGNSYWLAYHNGTGWMMCPLYIDNTVEDTVFGTVTYVNAGGYSNYLSTNSLRCFTDANGIKHVTGAFDKSGLSGNLPTAFEDAVNLSGIDAPSQTIFFPITGYLSNLATCISGVGQITTGNVLQVAFETGIDIDELSFITVSVSYAD